MQKRFVAIWFRYLRTDWFTRRQSALRNLPFVLSVPDHGRIVISAVNLQAEQQGIAIGMSVADARAIFPSIHVIEDQAELSSRLLKGLAEWCIRYTPFVAMELPDGLILDVTGCAHLWGGEIKYLSDIKNHLEGFGYSIRIAIADTIGAAWAASRFNQSPCIIKTAEHTTALMSLPPAALRLETDAIELLEKLGLRQIKDFIAMPRSVLRRRFGSQLLKRIDHAIGHEEEILEPVVPVESIAERLPCIEPIVTRRGIEIALQNLLKILCERLQAEGKGVRRCCFKCFRVDGKIEKIEIGTNRATYNAQHVFKLFELKLDSIEPALGIELFLLKAQKVEEVIIVQEKLWDQQSGIQTVALMELLDRFMGRFGADHIHRYLPDEHHWPERSIKPAASVDEKPTTSWIVDRPRPLQILPKPEPIEVTAPIPDYPPMLFRYRGKLHTIKKADGPERIEQEWWIEKGKHRDYYCVEDEEGHRYWLFRLGHYDAEKSYGWYLHGYFA